MNLKIVKKDKGIWTVNGERISANTPRKALKKYLDIHHAGSKLYFLDRRSK